ncbi:MAG: hypothetical protein ACRD44_19630, partial [Bryobacteraceae bacterium]
THSRYQHDKDAFADGTGITFVYKGVAERPRHANDRLVGYDLLPIHEHWWLKTKEGSWAERTFDGYFRYQPYGGRPGIPFAVGGSFLGRTESSNKAKPFWGWHDTQTLKNRVLAVGQWGLDPAYAVSRNLRFPAGQEFSLDYEHNPYLGIVKPGTIVEVSSAPVIAQPSQDAPPPLPSTAPSAQPTVVTPAPADPASLLASGLDTVAAQAGGGSVEIEAQVDGTIDVLLQRDAAVFEVRNGQPAAREKAVFTAPIPAAPATAWTVTKLAGRGSATLVEAPVAANGYRALIRLEDQARGSDFYRLRLEWRAP